MAMGRNAKQRRQEPQCIATSELARTVANPFYEQLNRISPTIGQQTGYAAALAEASGAREGLAVLDAIDQDAASAYQPYWAVRAHVLQLLGKGREAQHAYDRAIGFAEDPAVREFLLQQRG